MQQHHADKYVLFSLTLTAALLLGSCSSNTAPPTETAPKTEAPKADTAQGGTVVRLDPALDAIIPPNTQIEKLAGGFTFTEGPLWRPPNAIWFSDVVGNVVRQWTTAGKVTEILKPGGYDGNS